MGEGRHKVKWVPDEEVNDCPICERAFTSFTVRKHHCRACGKVVCGACSHNFMWLPGRKQMERVCDPCQTFHLHKEAATLSESMSASKSLQVALKANLSEKNAQADWFRGLMEEIVTVSNVGDSRGASSPRAVEPPSVSIQSEPPSLSIQSVGSAASSSMDPGRSHGAAEGSQARVFAPAVSVEGSPASSPRGPPSESTQSLAGSSAAASSANGATPAQPGPAHLFTAGSGAKMEETTLRWKRIHDNLQAGDEENKRLREEDGDLSRQYAAETQETDRLQHQVKHIEAAVTEGPIVVLERDTKAHNTRKLEKELEGLTRRKQTLQAEIASTASAASSFTNLSFSSLADSRPAQAARDAGRQCQASFENMWRSARRRATLAACVVS